MPTYVATAYCEKCAVNHPTAVELDCSEQISPEKNIAEVFEGMLLPPEIAMMSKNYFLYPQTGKMHKQADNTKMFLAKTYPALPLHCDRVTGDKAIYRQQCPGCESPLRTSRMPREASVFAVFGQRDPF